MQKKWLVARPISEETKLQFPEANPLVLQLLFNRGLNTQQAIDEFLRSDWSHDVHDPFLFADMHRAVDRIFQAKTSNEKIAIFGDYDADGVCGTAILYSTLKRLGFESIETYIPHRENEGYGLNKPAIEKLAAAGVRLLVTVDLGVANVAEIQYASELGLETIVVDHHDFKMESGKVILPQAAAIIHPRLPIGQAGLPASIYPYQYLSGGGTAFKLAQGLLAHTLEQHEAFEKWLLDLVAISTVADVVPLTGENRTLVKYGLLVLNKTQRPGLRELINISRLGDKYQDGLKDVAFPSEPLKRFNLTTWNLAFQLAPRINAAGRISHAREALELILSQNQTEAQALADHLNRINQERQKLADGIYQEAVALFAGQTDNYLLGAYKSGWPLGIVGLVAGRLADELQKPVVLLADVGGQPKGSARSIAGFHITKALGEAAHLLEQYGGHAGAAGFRVKPGQAPALIAALNQIATRELSGKDLSPVLAVEAEIEFSEIGWELAEAIEEFEPFGEANPIPRFLAKRLQVKDLKTVGSNGKHLKLVLSDAKGAATHPAIGFGLSKSAQPVTIGDKVDIVFELGFNEWNGSRELQIKIVDLRHSLDRG